MLAPMQSNAASFSARDRLIATASELLATGGLRSVTARALAELTGQSASAVNYHFAGREGLLAATFEAAATQAAEYRGAWASSLAAAPPREAFSGWYAAVILQRVAAAPAFLVLREMRHDAARSSAHRGLARRELEASDAFWRQAVAAFQLPPGAAEACADFAEAILGIHGGAPDYPDQTAWLIETVHRHCARLGGARGPTRGWDGWRQLARARSGLAERAEARLAGGAGRIAAAAAEVLGREGLAGLTHRAVAAEVGLSLAAVSGAFPTRAGLVRAAFDHLIASIHTVRSGVVPDPGVRRPIAELAVEMAEALFDADGAAPPGLLALDELLTAAIREPDLRRDAEDLRASRGENSATLLLRMNHATDPVDGLDAHILSIVATGAMRSAYALEPSARRAWLAKRLTTSLAALFG
ncbi:TetR/AcrR family transcriptional regulator [Phenylobacterium sp.]|uniref:TetR/AcrR family transcriptional regulator n=2 Tax=Phenylobacterium sp. TaxID=1871053 RepID=UPI00272F2C04|nr:TetR family transcriptional regulator [Phenylobacterium sp.]MDP1987404.1 TetR family transcriptional regulator [Phenylobacterium sp.]